MSAFLEGSCIYWLPEDLESQEAHVQIPALAMRISQGSPEKQKQSDTHIYYKDWLSEPMTMEAEKPHDPPCVVPVQV